jgi:hypothetical protein
MGMILSTFVINVREKLTRVSFNPFSPKQVGPILSSTKKLTSCNQNTLIQVLKSVNHQAIAVNVPSSNGNLEKVKRRKQMHWGYKNEFSLPDPQWPSKFP